MTSLEETVNKFKNIPHNRKKSDPEREDDLEGNQAKDHHNSEQEEVDGSPMLRNRDGVRDRMVSYEDHVSNLAGATTIHTAAEFSSSTREGDKLKNKEGGSRSAQIQELQAHSKEMTQSLTNFHVGIHTRIGQRTVLAETEDVEISVAK